MRWLMLVAILSGCDVIFRLDYLPAPDAPPPIVGRWSAVDGGWASTCALDDDHHLWCWGTNENGELGLSSSLSESLTIQQVGDATWSSISVNYATTCGVQTDGSGWCWGWNQYGQVGDGTATIARAPKQVAGGPWVEISAGLSHTCGIHDSDRSAWCWGSGEVGELGIGYATGPHPDPVQVAEAGPWQRIAAGLGSTCAIRMDDQSLWCWGDNGAGQLGTGTTTTAYQPVKVGTDTWIDVSLGYGYACGITTTHRLRCWGENEYGMLGDGSQGRRTVPAAVLVAGVDRTDWRRVVASLEHTCAISEDGALYCWGSSLRGDVGVDGEYAVLEPRRMEGPLAWTAMGTGASHTCAIAADHTMFCLGSDGGGQLGDGGTSVAIPTKVADNITTVATAEIHTCVIDGAGKAFCAGTNIDGNLGIGNRTSSAGFVKVNDMTWTAIATGGSHTCAVSGNTVWCWGDNGRGELGNGSMALATAPISIGPGTTITTTAHTCTINQDVGYCWGLNNNGELGNGGTNPGQPFPTSVQSVTFASISAGGRHTCGLASTKQAYCWGDSGSGQLGTGTFTQFESPTAVLPATSGKQITTGFAHTCLVRDDKSAACWGNNSRGQVGVGDTNDHLAPVPIGGEWLAMSAGSTHTCGIRGDNSLACWGANDRGQLGDGMHSDRTTPVPVGVERWATVSAGTGYTCATKLTDNSLWCWGDNNYGQLALPAWRTSFVQVP